MSTRGALGFALALVALVVLVVVIAVLSSGLPRGADTRPGYAPPATAPVPAEASARDTWVDGVAGRTDVPARAVRAYGAAEVAARSAFPACRVTWATLAGIGRVESVHGTYDGAELTPDGRALPPVRGPALDGTGGNRAIADTDDGRLDGDPVWDRAVGPMQFIPSTWRGVGTDADGDGVADPHDLDDAAAAAATYLCAGPTGRGLGSGSGGSGGSDASGGGTIRDLGRGDDRRAALLSYNASTDYLDAVHARSVGYADAVGDAVGPRTGPADPSAPPAG